MAPSFLQISQRDFDPSAPSQRFSTQWKNPSDVFSVLLLLGGDVVARALAQLVGSRVTPVAFSFGWVAYAVTALVSAIGENKLMPLPDCDCKVINGKSGYIRDNASWVIGRMVRDYDSWMDAGDSRRPIRTALEQIIDEKWTDERAKAERKSPGTKASVPKPTQTGLCVSIYRAQQVIQGHPGHDWVYHTGFATAILQLGIASIPCGLFGDWGILLVTGCGITLSFGMGSLSQWKREKWACRSNSTKTMVLTRGNGSQHAIIIIGDGQGLDLEDLARGPVSTEAFASLSTRLELTGLALLWVLLLITAAALQHNTWYLLAVGGIGILQNIYVAAATRAPDAYGMPLRFEQVIARPKVMDTLFAVEEVLPCVGRSMLETFFPGSLRPEEEKKWAVFKAVADAMDVKT